MNEFVTFKRWTLKDHQLEPDLVTLIREGIVPMYAKLPGCRKIGLLRIDGTCSYLATQHWESRDSYDTVTSSSFYQEWFKIYEPALKRWDDLMSLEEEWESEEISLYEISNLQLQ
ncbi:MAG: antibiotic biosynthesis monooxygenase [Chloroflexota bacterium]